MAVACVIRYARAAADANRFVWFHRVSERHAQTAFRVNEEQNLFLRARRTQRGSSDVFIREIDERIIFAILDALRKRCRHFGERNRRLEERLDGLESEECVGLDGEGLVEVRVGSHLVKILLQNQETVGLLRFSRERDSHISLLPPKEADVVNSSSETADRYTAHHLDHLPLRKSNQSVSCLVSSANE